MSHIQKLCGVERVFYNESAFTFSDLFTRVTVTIDELGSEWPVSQSSSSDDDIFM